MLGIALVVDDANKGQRLVFRYPAPRDPTPYGPSATLEKYTAEFHHISPEVFARLFRPKAPLCGQSMQLGLDRINFISHPVLTASATKETATDEILLFNVVIAAVKPEIIHGPAPAAAAARRSTRRTSTSTSTSPSKSKPRPRQHNWPPPPDTKASTIIVGDWEEEGVPGTIREALSRLAKALLHEEKRCRYVSREVNILLEMREVFFGKDMWGTDDTQTMLESMLERSALANDLKQVYHGLRAGGTLSVVVNGWVHLSMQVHPDTRLLTDPILDCIKPYHTILPLVHESRLLEKLPPDGSLQLTLLIDALSPLKTLLEISQSTRISMSQLRYLAAHLVHWGYAKITCTISLQNTYALKSSAMIKRDSPNAMAFHQQFPQDTLLQTLALFGTHKQLADLLKGMRPDAQKEFLSKLVWLLQHDLIEQLHKYLYYLQSEESSRGKDGVESHPLFRRLHAGGYLEGDLHLLDVLWAEQLERQEVLDFCAAFPESILINHRPDRTGMG